MADGLSAAEVVAFGLLHWTVRPAEAGATSLIVGNRHADPTGTWTLYIEREPIGEVQVTRCVKAVFASCPIGRIEK